MPTIKSAIRRAKKSKKQALINRARKSKYKAAVKKMTIYLNSGKTKEATCAITTLKARDVNPGAGASEGAATRPGVPGHGVARRVRPAALGTAIPKSLERSRLPWDG